jgi:hypothetical protein
LKQQISVIQSGLWRLDAVRAAARSAELLGKSYM